jgi:hypothetical protein
MEKQSNSIKPADARIVQAVRKLKSSKIVDQIEVHKNEEEIKQSGNNTAEPEGINDIINSQKKAKKALTPITQSTKTNITNNNLTNVNNTNNTRNNNVKGSQIKKDISKSSSKIKISIDGSTIKPNTGSTNKTSKTFDYETLKKYKKRQKSDYQKNLLSKKSIDKYKEECVNLIKKEPEMKNLLAQIGINKDDDYLLYINNTFFNKPYFLFSLEILILEAVEEANTLKVFRTNKNVLPLKVVKENFYRDEIIKDLKLKIYEGEYSNKYNNLMQQLDNFIDNLKSEEV